MISDELRRALEKLNRGPLQVQGGKTGDSARPVPRAVLVGELAPSRLLQDGNGACLVFERTVKDFFDEAGSVAEPFRSVFVEGRHGLGDLDPDSPWRRLLSQEPEGMSFLDIETLGLAGSPVFLVGLLLFERDQLVIRQFFSRDYSEESAMLAWAAKALGTCRSLVTFNGKTFDVPTLSDRMAAHLLVPPAIAFHFDLLHESRRRFRHILPNCKLQTLEYHICRRRRTGDVPGELIPQLYHDFVATGDASGIRTILHHNALDLIAMTQILTFIAQGGELTWTD